MIDPAALLQLVSSCEELEEGAPLMFEPGGAGDWFRAPLRGKVTEEEIRNLFMGKMVSVATPTLACAASVTRRSCSECADMPSLGLGVLSLYGKSSPASRRDKISRQASTIAG